MTGACSASPPRSPRHARLASGGFPWAGTFHSVGARLLREFAGRIGLDPAFTIHDREDSADLMNLVRHELGCRPRASASPQGHLPGHLLGGGQHPRP
jgi:DNA helicase-2/ATP-dependent DNA helicase PcrA